MIFIVISHNIYCHSSLPQGEELRSEQETQGNADITVNNREVPLITSYPNCSSSEVSMMMSSSMASTASVSISSKGKKRLLSLFSLVRTTLRGTAILGHRDSAQEKEEQVWVLLGFFCESNIFKFEKLEMAMERSKRNVQTQRARTNPTTMTFLAGQERRAAVF